MGNIRRDGGLEMMPDFEFKIAWKKHKPQRASI